MIIHHVIETWVGVFRVLEATASFTIPSYAVVVAVEDGTVLSAGAGPDGCTAALLFASCPALGTGPETAWLNSVW